MSCDEFANQDFVRDTRSLPQCRSFEILRRSRSLGTSAHRRRPHAHVCAHRILDELRGLDRRLIATSSCTFVHSARRRAAASRESTDGERTRVLPERRSPGRCRTRRWQSTSRLRDSPIGEMHSTNSITYSHTRPHDKNVCSTNSSSFWYDSICTSRGRRMGEFHRELGSRYNESDEHLS